MGDTFAVMNTLTTTDPKTAIIIGAGYIGLEMAEGLTTRGLASIFHRGDVLACAVSD